MKRFGRTAASWTLAFAVLVGLTAPAHVFPEGVRGVFASAVHSVVRLGARP